MTYAPERTEGINKNCHFLVAVCCFFLNLSLYLIINKFCRLIRRNLIFFVLAFSYHLSYILRKISAIELIHAPYKKIKLIQSAQKVHLEVLEKFKNLYYRTKNANPNFQFSAIFLKLFSIFHVSFLCCSTCSTFL